MKLANIRDNEQFRYSIIHKARVKKETLTYHFKKSTPKGDIPAKILKDSIEFIIDNLTNLTNYCRTNNS